MTGAFAPSTMQRQATMKPAGAGAGDNSEAILAMLESCNLSEEDTEMLLTDAYALNRRLREELTRITEPEGRSQQPHVTASARTPAAKELPPLRNAPGAGHSSDRLRDVTRIYRSGSGVFAAPLASSRRQKEVRPASLARKEWQ